LIYDGPTDGLPEKAAAMVDRWALQRVDAIAVSPNDPQVLAGAMRAARAQGVAVVTFDADGVADSRQFFVNQASAREIADALVDTMARDLGPEGGEVAIVTATLTAANQNAWIAHMQERLPRHPALRLVAIKPSDEDQNRALQVSRDLMHAHPALRGLFAISSVAFPGAAEAVRQSGRQGRVLVTGLSTPNEMKQYVKDGTVKSVILWNAVDLGYLAVHVASAVAEGRLAPGASSLTAGRLGTRKVAGDQVLLGELLVFTKENIDQFGF
jgi:ABC-type sugar transport system substrate-binding protein